MAAGNVPSRQTLLESTDPVLLRKAGKQLRKLPADPDLRQVTVAVLATSTVGPYRDLLTSALVGAGMWPAIDPGEYGTFEITLASGRFTTGADPDLVSLLMDESFFLPADWSPTDVPALAAHVEGRLHELGELVAAALAGTAATVVLHTVPLPAQVRDGLVSLRDRAAVAQLWTRLNAGLLDLAREHPQVVTADLVGLLADAPFAARDERLHRYADLPYTDGALLLLAGEVRRAAQARAGLSRKVLALDLDNTLWGGVLGEAGAEGIELGGLYPGNAYKQLQLSVRRLREQGVILVLASKNDAALVDEVLAGHPEMVLGADAFAVRAVNWKAKAENLRAAAESLGLSTESMVFLDDSPFERGHVTAELPGTVVLDASGDPAHLVRTLLRTGWFDVLDLTKTDLQRPQLYRARALRSDFSTGFGSSQDYLTALGLRLTPAPVTGYTVARAAQLAARTNQFNLTGERFDQATTTAMSTSADHLVATFEVSDRFGDEGVVGAAWVHRDGDRWRVLNLVLSCRVLGRGIDLAIAGWLARQARAAGATRLEASYVASKKNGVAAGFWTTAGFAAGAEPGSFVLDLTTEPGDLPGWITLRERSDA
ncbi:HAD-IIIC family phosphatase [Winogradskya consettensis]|uniref:HAD-superfamily phosphatase, subfamily IIIC:FkbH n=1 Tax=Winogradskya consettensis TaxID=113560 RepID=A0A919VM29_9ACTN|nr:HAD-IIIC family phosphatase [Actinoplanes consettensis]GIM68399.1 HAD-superfamily phosphatase, subfamily IIIC:FkbH [Actinoplanes consettensis]